MFGLALGESAVVVLRFLEFARVVEGLPEVVVDQEFRLLVFGLPAVLQGLLVEEDGFSVVLELLRHEAQREKRLRFEGVQVGVGGEDALSGEQGTAWS